MIQKLGQVTGTGTQIYSEDAIADLIRDAFYQESRRLWLGRQMAWFQRTLDGSTGVITTNIGLADGATTGTGVLRFEDIKAVWLGTQSTPLPVLSGEINPYVTTYASVFIEPTNDPLKLFRIWPLATTGTVYIRARQLPIALLGDDTVLLESDVLMYRACWEYCADDGANPGAEAKFKARYQDAVKLLSVEQTAKPIQIDPRFGALPTGYTEYPLI